MNKELLKRSQPIIILFVVSAAIVVAMAWFLTYEPSTEVELTNDSGEPLTPLVANELLTYDEDMISDNNPIAVFNTSEGVIEIELFENVMPITAGNFIKLANEDFYDGTKFHRVIDGFMIQGGDPLTKTAEVMRYGTGGPGYAIQDEHVSAEYLTNTRGTISMANSGPNSGGSQFFINLTDNTNLDFDKQPLSSKHPVFGKVISGIEIVDAIGGTETNPGDLPVSDIVIESVEIKNKG